MPSTDLSMFSLMANASGVVQCVMALLFFISLLSWTAIFSKALALRREQNQTRAFEEKFWSGIELMSLLRNSEKSKQRIGTLERIFVAGLREFLKVREKDNDDRGTHLDAARRAMKACYQREMDILEARLPFLASAGSVSPYIGLFGTVWGIIHAFRGLANVQQATLASVAPGIAEALVATAIGLFAAIPAVVAYNRYSTEIDRLASRFESFIEEFSNILQRHTL